MKSIQFVQPWILLLLWAVAGIGLWWIIWIRRRSNRISSFVSATMQEKLAPKTGTLRIMFQAGMTILALALMVFALARPQWGKKDITIFQRGRDLMIVLDVSRSMLANDVHPSRLIRAKIDILDLIRELEGDRAGLLVFRNNTALLCPLTTDYAFLRLALDGADELSAKPGPTDIGRAIRDAIAAFDDESPSHKAIILISDGEDLENGAIEAAKEAGEKGIPIFTVGLGSPKGSRIPDKDTKDGFYRHDDEVVVTKLQNEALARIARESKGRYMPIQRASTATQTLGTLYKEHMRSVSDKFIEETQKETRVDRYQPFLIPAIILLIAATFLSRGRLARKPVGQKGNPTTGATEQLVVLALLASLLAAPSASAQTNTSSEDATAPTDIAAPTKETNSEHSADPRKAQALFRKGDYEAAAKAYLDAARAATPNGRDRLKYNAGVSLFKAGEYEHAAQIFEEMRASSPEPSSDLLFAHGTSLYRETNPEEGASSTNLSYQADKLKEAGDAFMAATRADPESDAAKKNLALLRDRWPQAEKDARTQALLKKYSASPSSAIVQEMLTNQRDINKGIFDAFENKTPQRIDLLESAAKKQEDNAALWTPLRGKLAQDMSSKLDDKDRQKKMMQLTQMMDATEENMHRAVSRLENLDSESYYSAVMSEEAVYKFWKGVAPYDLLLKEDIRRQTNAINMSEAVKSMPPAPRQKKQILAEQDEVGSLTKLFHDRFSEANKQASAPAQPASPEGGKSQISEEDRLKILDLTEKAIATQAQAIDSISSDDLTTARGHQKKSYELLKEIEKLLPKNKNNQQKQPEKQPQKQPEKQPKKQPQKQPQKQPEQKQPQKQKPEEKKPKKPDDATPEDVKKMLEKARQREKEHADRKRQRRHIPLPGVGRDW